MSELPLLNSSATAGAINDVDSRLALELAMDMSEISDILDRHGLTAAQLKEKLNTTEFRAMVKEFKSWWKSDLSVKERIRLKSMVLVEDSLLEIYSIVHSKETTASSRLDAFKSLAKVATVDVPDKDGQAAGERVQINISIPGTEKAITYDAEVLQDDGSERRETITYSTQDAEPN